MRGRACVEVEVRHGHRLIGVALVEIDGDAGGRRSPIPTGDDVITRPAAVSDERRGDQTDGGDVSQQLRVFSDRVDKDRSTDRVANEDGAIVKLCDFPFKPGAPGSEVWVFLIGHARIADVMT